VARQIRLGLVVNRILPLLGHFDPGTELGLSGGPRGGFTDASSGRVPASLPPAVPMEGLFHLVYRLEFGHLFDLLAAAEGGIAGCLHHLRGGVKDAL